MKVLRLYIFLLVSVLLFSTCKKENKKLENPTTTPVTSTPDPYTYSPDLQSSRDISATTYHVLDLDMMGSFLGERVLNHFYKKVLSAPATDSSMQIVDTSATSFWINFNHTPGKDGKTRNGMAYFYYGYDFGTNRDARPEGRNYR